MELFNEFISILITIIAVIYTFSTLAKSAARAGRTKRTPDEREVDDEDMFEEEESFEDESFEEFVLKQEAPKPKAIKLPPPPVAATPAAAKQEAVGDFDFHSKLDDYTQKTSIDDRALEIHLRPGSELGSDAFRLAQSEGAVIKRPTKASIKQLIKSLPEEQLLFLSYEVFHVPVSKRSSPFPWNG